MFWTRIGAVGMRKVCIGEMRFKKRRVMNLMPNGNWKTSTSVGEDMKVSLGFNVKSSEDILGRHPGSCWHMMLFSSGKKGDWRQMGHHLQREELKLWKVKWPGRKCMALETSGPLRSEHRQ